MKVSTFVAGVVLGVLPMLELRGFPSRSNAKVHMKGTFRVQMREAQTSGGASPRRSSEPIFLGAFSHRVTRRAIRETFA